MTTLVPPDLIDLDSRVDRLRGALLGELPAPRRTASRRRGLALAIAAIVVAIAGAGAIATRAPSPALAVERQDGWLVLRITDLSAGEQELTRELREAGVSGEVQFLPVPSAAVGSWVVISEWADRPGPRPQAPPAGGPGPEEATRLERVRYQRETLRIPISEVRESTGYFVFYAGRAVGRGERPYQGRGDWERFRP